MLPACAIIRIVGKSTAKKELSIDGNDDVTGAISGVDFLNLVTGQSLTQGSTDDYAITSPKYDNINAGVNKSVSGTVTLKAAGTVAKNYTFAGGLTAPLPSGVKGEITKDGSTQVAFASAPTLPANSVGTYTFDLNTLTPTNTYAAGTLIFSNAQFVDGTSTDDVTGNDAATIVGGDGHTLTYETTGGSTNSGNSAMVTVDVESQNYADGTVSLVIALTANVVETLSFPNTSETFTYGTPIFSNPATRGTNTALPTYSSDDTSVATVDTDGKVTIAGEGSATITAETPMVAGMPGRTGATASYDITVNPAPLTVTALPQTISSSTNIDTAPSTSTVSYSGFVSGEDESTVTITVAGLLERRDPTDVTAGTYPNEIIFNTVPVITNYAVTQAATGGTLTIAEAPNLTSVKATGGNSLIRVSYVATPNGSPIGDVEVEINDGEASTTYTRTGPSPVEVPAANGKTYTVKVRVKNGVGWNTEGQVSAPEPAKPTAPSTPAPSPSISNVKATAGDAKATVTFTANNAGKPVTNYTVTSSPDGITATGTGTSIIVTGLTNGTAYTFKVTVNFTDGSSITSAASTPAVTPSAGTGIDDVEEIPTLKLYPNPASDIVTITGLQGNETIRFYDANGRSVLTHKAKASEEVITVSQLQKGIYIVHIGTKALKLVKI